MENGDNGQTGQEVLIELCRIEIEADALAQSGNREGFNRTL